MNDCPLLPRKRCEELCLAVQLAAARAGVRDVEVSLGAGEEALTRFANNQIHQNVAERNSSLSIRVVVDHRTARATTNRLHRDGIQAAVDEVIALARASEPDPELLPLFFGERAAGIPRWFAATADCTPHSRARAVADMIQIIEGQGQTAAGIYSTGQAVEALLNSAGVFQYHAETLAQCSVTAMAADSSGWAKATSADLADLRPEELARTAVWKAAKSANPRELAPGRFTVVLEPAAVLDLVGQIFGDFSGTALSDQRSFLNDRLGKRIFGENISIYDDVESRLQTGAPFDGEGVSRRRVALVEKGVPDHVVWSRMAAAKAGTVPTGHGFPLPNDAGEAPVNVVIAGEDRSVEDLIAGTANGILVTRFWYIRETEPYEKRMTGMTRDGTFLLRDGEIVGGLRNFRFNQSVVEMLCNVEALSRTQRASGEEAFDMAVPGMKVNDFHFSEVTKF